MRYLLLLPLVFIASCSTPPPKEHVVTYRECMAKQEKLRAERFSEMPESLRALAGKHSVVKFFDKRPKNLAEVAVKLQKENNIFNARKEKAEEGDIDMRLLDTSPGRNRLQIGFEKRDGFLFSKSPEDRLLFKMDYGKPTIGYYFPLSAMKEKGKAWEGYFSSSVKLKTPKTYTGDKTFAKINLYIYVEPINKEYTYVEWVNRDFDPADDPNWKSIHAVLYTADDDRYLDWEHPYFDNKGELNPEECTALPGG